MIVDHPNENVRKRAFEDQYFGLDGPSKYGKGQQLCFQVGCEIDTRSSGSNTNTKNLIFPTTITYFSFRTYRQGSEKNAAGRGIPLHVPSIGGFPSKEPIKDELWRIEDLRDERNDLAEPRLYHPMATGSQNIGKSERCRKTETAAVKGPRTHPLMSFGVKM